MGRGRGETYHQTSWWSMCFTLLSRRYASFRRGPSTGSNPQQHQPSSSSSAPPPSPPAHEHLRRAWVRASLDAAHPAALLGIWALGKVSFPLRLPLPLALLFSMRLG